MSSSRLIQGDTLDIVFLRARDTKMRDYKLDFHFWYFYTRSIDSTYNQLFIVSPVHAEENKLIYTPLKKINGKTGKTAPPVKRGRETHSQEYEGGGGGIPIHI